MPAGVLVDEVLVSELRAMVRAVFTAIKR